MSLLSWTVRCVPGLSLILLLILIESALSIIQTEYFLIFRDPKSRIGRHGPVFAEVCFIAYSVFLHLLAATFPLRLCRACWQASNQIKEAHDLDCTVRLLKKEDTKSTANRAIGDQDIALDLNTQKDSTIQAIMIPSYKEDIGLLEDTLRVLASHKLAATNYDVVLAMEARDPNATSTAEKLLSGFKHRFQDMQYTIHPADLEGEAPGKSSNIGWAADHLRQKYSNSVDWKDVLLTVMDSDTHLLSHYFEAIQVRHIQNRQQGDMIDMTLYMPPIVFDRNAHLVPALVRMADLMWCGAGLSCYQSTWSRTAIAIPTAVYTLPLPLVELVHGWDTGPGAIGEDMHMMLKCYFATNGNLAVECIPSPASHCNVHSSKGGISGYISSHHARYRQGLRHMWGCLDTGYAITQWAHLGSKLPMVNNGKPRKLSHTELELKLSQYQLHGSSGRKFTWRNVVLFSRLFEAHFLPNHLFLVLLSSAIYDHLRGPSLVHHRYWLSVCLDVTGNLRFLSFMFMMTYFVVFYSRYHRVCIAARESAMRRAGLWEDLVNLDNNDSNFAYRPARDVRSWLDYLIFPIAGCVFGSLPAMQAALSHFWSDRLFYTVSEKPKRLVSDAPPVEEV